MTDLPRIQHIVASGVIAAVGVTIAYISYTQEPAQAFVFPRLVATVFAVLALWTFGKALMRKSKLGNGVSLTEFINLLPGVAVMGVYIFWAAKFFGFYTATAVTFFILLSIYDPAPHTSVKSWIKRVIITAGFIAVMYGLFALLLRVYTPREMFF